MHQIGDKSVGFPSDIFTEKIPLFKFLKSVKAKSLLGDAFERQ